MLTSSLGWLQIPCVAKDDLEGFFFLIFTCLASSYMYLIYYGHVYKLCHLSCVPLFLLSPLIFPTSLPFPYFHV